MRVLKVDKVQKTYQIKARLAKNKNTPTSFDFRKLGKFDYLIIVLFVESNFKLLHTSYKIPRTLVKKLIVKNENGFRLRWNKHTRSLLDRN